MSGTRVADPEFSMLSADRWVHTCGTQSHRGRAAGNVNAIVTAKRGPANNVQERPQSDSLIVYTDPGLIQNLLPNTVCENTQIPM